MEEIISETIVSVVGGEKEERKKEIALLFESSCSNLIRIWEKDEAKYVVCLVLCLLFGLLVRKVGFVWVRKLFGLLFGVGFSLFVLGDVFFHSLVTILVCCFFFFFFFL